MTKETDLVAQAQKGEKAERIINDPLVKEALDKMRTTVYNNIESSHFEAVGEREELYKTLKVIRQFEKSFADEIRAATKAKHKLEELNKGN